MNSCIAIKNSERPVYTQIEEERQRLKKKEQFKRLLNGSEFQMKGKCAISLMQTKLDIINTILTMKYGRNVIQTQTGRLKEFDSICKKMQKKGLELNFDLALEKINDLIGVRACAFEKFG